MTTEFTRPSIKVVGLSLGIALLSSCAGSCGTQQPPKLEVDPDGGPYVIHLLTGPDRRPMDVGPVRFAGVPSATPGWKPAAVAHAPAIPEALRPKDSGAPVGTKGLATKDVTVGTPDGGAATLPSDFGNSDPNSWLLVAGAAAECGLGLTQGGTMLDAAIPPWSTTLSAAPWAVFNQRPQSCEQLIQYEQTLLCMAAKLDEIADAVGNVTWSKVPTTPVAVGGGALLPAGPWVFPPQRNADRFVARDLAIYLLANLALTDMFIPEQAVEVGPKTVCSEALATAVQTPSTGRMNRSFLFDIPLPPPGDPAFLDDPALQSDKWKLGQTKLSLNDANMVSIGRYRLDLEGHILRAAGRLTKDLIEKSVYADLSTAERRRARATDHLRGSKLAWGAVANPTDGGDAVYGSLAHAVRILEGRWEIGPYLPPTVSAPVGLACGGVQPTELLRDMYGADITARDEDVPTQTPGQRAALLAVQRAAIVLPEAVIATQDEATLKAALTAQLKLKAAEADGVASSAMPAPRAQALALQVQELAEGDLRFALRRNSASYRLLTNGSASATLTPTAPAGGLKADTLAPELVALGGTAIKEGLPRAALTIDMRARTGGINEASHCDEAVPYSGWTADNSTTLTFENSFGIGQSLWRRLTVLREVTNLVPGLESTNRLAGMGAAEHRAWSGPGQFTAGALIGQAFPDVGDTYLITSGFTPEDWGAADMTKLNATLSTRIKLVFGEPFVADCVAGIRTECPPATELASVTSSPSFAIASGPDGGNARITGTDGFVGTFVFPAAGPPKFLGTAKNTTGKHVYVVLVADPAAGYGEGKVLGTIALRTPYVWSSSTVSSLQAEMMSKLLGISPSVGGSKGEKGDDTTSFSPSYCIEDVPRNLFVPLENELTSDSDAYENSWRHYLQLAESAATKADELGNQLVQQGLQQDFRKEAAQEELAKVCGSYTSLDKVTSKAGKVVAPSDDAALKSCLSADKVDVVLATEDPTDPSFDKNDPVKRTTWLKANILLCSGVGAANTLCNRGPCAAAGDAGCLTYASLGIAGPYISAVTTTTSSCGAATVAAASVRTGFEGGKVAEVATQPWLSGDVLKERLRGVRFRYTAGGSEWELYANGSVLMSSSATSGLWPGCGRVLGGCTTSGATTMRDVFASTSEIGALTLSDTQVAAIGWRVEGAVWLLAGMSGSLPPSLFTVPVPIADFNAAAWGGVSDDLRTVAVPTVFGSSRFGVDGTLEIASGDSADRALLAGSISPFPRRWPDAAPKWLVDIGGAAGRYRAILAPSTELTGLIDPDTTTDRLDLFVSTIAPQLTGTCSGGTPSPTALVARQTIFRRKRGPQFVVGSTSSSATAGDVPICTYGGGGHGPALTMRLQPTPGAPVAGVTFRNQLYYQTANEEWSGEEDDDYFAYCKGFGEGDPEPASHLSAIVPKFGFTPTIDSDYHGPVCGRFRTSETSDFGCSPTSVDGMQMLKASCVRDTVLTTSTWKPGEKPARGYKRYTERLLLPQVCTPGQRVLSFANGYPAATTCDAAAELAQAVALACHLSNTDAFPISDDPPAINGVDDLATLAKWVDKQGKRISAQTSKIHFESVPKSVIDDFVRGSAGTGSIAGEAGERRAQLYQSMLGVAQQITTAGGQLQSIGKALTKAYADLKVLELQKDIDALNLARAQIGLHRDITVRATSAVSSIARIFTAKEISPGGAVAGASDAAGAAAAIGFDVAELAKIKEIGDKTTQKAYTETRRVMISLEAEVGTQYTNLTSTLLGLRKSASETISIGKSVASLEGKAQYEAAKGAGEDYFTDPTTGKAVPIPVNTVLKRQYAITERRYKRVLHDAKYLAYLARLAIEQRLGVRLNTITTKVGALEPPAQWADDVCSLTGIDYRALRNPAATADGGVKADAIAALDEAVIADFADQYVGDYVAKLRNLVEYYNVKYPSKDGDDVAVLSLQDDFGSCVREAPNLLLQSSSLETAGPPTTVGATASGWSLRSCEIGDLKCLKVAPGLTVKNPPLAPTVGALAGYSWLYDGPGLPATPTPPSGGTPIDPGPTATTKPSSIFTPKHAVAQIVGLEPSEYVLSWWDQARAADSDKATAPSTVPYRVQVFDATGAVVASVDNVPFVDGAGGWSPRRTLAVKVSAKGAYIVSFTPSVTTTGAGGSILVGNVQLEQNAGGAGATGYTGTSWTRTYLSNDCKGVKKTPVFEKFEHRCDATGCWKELTAPLLIDTSALNAGGAAFKGKLAAQNFNFRHVTLAVNLVGTGVRDCSSTPSGSCFGSGYLEYTLTHDAFNSGIVAWDGTTQFFNFGGGAIRHGKALAAERYITLPLSSADTGLLFTPATEKQEFRGRPLDGIYRLRIHEDPSLRWSRLEDVQIVLKYRYWSAIQPQPPGT